MRSYSQRGLLAQTGLILTSILPWDEAKVKVSRASEGQRWTEKQKNKQSILDSGHLGQHIWIGFYTVKLLGKAARFAERNVCSFY